MKTILTESQNRHPWSVDFSPPESPNPSYSRTKVRAPFLHLLSTLLLLTLPLHAQDEPAAVIADAEQAVGDNTAPELTEAADRAIERGLQYLLSTQNPDGSWSGEDGKFKMAGTSLGLMAFMVRGEFPGFGRNGAALDRAKDFLLKHDRESPTGYAGGMYEHGLYTLALSELWGMTDNK